MTKKQSTVLETVNVEVSSTEKNCNICGVSAVEVLNYFLFGMRIPYCPECFIEVFNRLKSDGVWLLRGERRKRFVEEVETVKV